MKRILLMFACLIMLTSCAGGETDWASFAPSPEDRLVIYTSHKEAVYGPVVKEFEERTGIWVQVETGGTSALLSRLEDEAEEPGCDLLFGGGVDSLQARRDLFAPYVSPLAECLPPACRSEDGSWTAFSLLPVVLIYNPVLVRMNPPEGWESLLDPAWRGKIAFSNPLVSGSAFTALSTLLQAVPGDPIETLEAFYANLGGRILSDSGDVAAAVADGSCTIGVTLEETALKAAESASDVALLYPKEGTVCLPDGMAVIKGAPHADNARRFIDFCLSEDVQGYLQSFRRRPVRADVERTLPGMDTLRLLDYDLDWAARERETLLARWKELGEDAP